ncbi:uncharacterized protein C11orf52 homolog [Manis javanica]|uniref:uncharacterized protein C11orf52 homolog n=1 Tax=Manis javanica TaxID=9974 RepID=UPI003C6D7627|nr:hypothetical protein MM560_G66n325 [Manis javanica]
MGNWFGCGGSWGGPSAFQRKKKTGSQARWILRQQNGPKDTAERAYERGCQQPAPRERNPGVRPESSLHYADIHVRSRAGPRSAAAAKHLQLESATEYATLRFPDAAPRYDSKNGTLV